MAAGGRTSVDLRTALVLIFLSFGQHASALSGMCPWDRHGQYFTCPGSITSGGTSAYTRCCTLEAPPHLNTFVAYWNFGTPACCIERTAAHTSSSNIPAPLAVTLNGPSATTGPIEGRPTAIILDGDNRQPVQEDDDSGLSTNAIIGIAITCVAGFIIIVIVAYIIYSVTRKKKDDSPPEEVGNGRSDGRESPYARRKQRQNSSSKLMCFSATAV